MVIQMKEMKRKINVNGFIRERRDEVLKCLQRTKKRGGGL